jgi:hypothetical protein
MVSFITACLTVFVLAFLVMLCIQAIRIEKHITDLVDLAQSKVTKLYEQTD